MYDVKQKNQFKTINGIKEMMSSFFNETKSCSLLLYDINETM